MPTTQDVSCFVEDYMRPARQMPVSGRNIICNALPAAALLTAGLIGLAAATLTGAPRNDQYLVVSAPWSTPGQTINLIRSADGGLIESGRFANMAIAGSTSGDFAQHARQAGAWLVVPSPFKTGCFASPTES